MFDRISLTQLPRSLQDLVQQTTASEQAKREKRRSVLAREIRAEEAAVAKESPALVAAVDRAIAEQEEARGALRARDAAVRAAFMARDTRGYAHDLVVNPRRNELIGLADPRIAEFCSELLELERHAVHLPVDTSVETREVPIPRHSSVGFMKIPARVYSNKNSIEARLTAIRETRAKALRLRETADVDVGDAIAKLRASIPTVAFEKELVFDDKVLPPITGLIEPVHVAGTPDADPAYVDAWKPR